MTSGIPLSDGAAKLPLIPEPLNEPENKPLMPASEPDEPKARLPEANAPPMLPYHEPPYEPENEPPKLPYHGNEPE